MITIWRNSDPVWDKIWPPNGWNCRCYVKPLNQEEINNAPVQPVNSTEQVDAVVKEGRIGKDFQRNPGQVRSIWGKWLQAKTNGKNYENMTNEIVKAGYSMPAWEKVEPYLNKAAIDYPEEIELTKENWQRLFGPFPGKVNTKLGEFKFGGDFYDKLKRRDREKLLALIKPTIENPSFVFVDNENGTLFVKSFRNKNGIKYYVGILKLKDEELFISFHEKENIIRKVNEGKFLLDHSFLRASGNTGGKEKFTHDAGRVNYTKLNIDSSKDNANIIKDANEIWAETYNNNGVVNSEINFIRYRIEGFELVKVNNNKTYELKFYDYSRIDDYRKGVTIK